MRQTDAVAWKRKLKRSHAIAAAQPNGDGNDERFKLRGWAEFERDGYLAEPQSVFNS